MSKKNSIDGFPVQIAQERPFQTGIAIMEDRTLNRST